MKYMTVCELYLQCTAKKPSLSPKLLFTFSHFTFHIKFEHDTHWFMQRTEHLTAWLLVCIIFTQFTFPIKFLPQTPNFFVSYSQSTRETAHTLDTLGRRHSNPSQGTYLITYGMFQITCTSKCALTPNVNRVGEVTTRIHKTCPTAPTASHRHCFHHPSTSGVFIHAGELCWHAFHTYLQNYKGNQNEWNWVKMNETRKPC